MKLTFLGTGTSHGVPTIGCDCAVCHSADPRDRRLRSSLYVEAGGAAVLVDASPDLRQQALRFGVRRVDAVCVTHAHADHIFGMDDLRRFNEMQGQAIPIHGEPATLAVLRRTFAYAFEPGIPGTPRPQLELRELDGPLSIGGLRVTPLPVWHGPWRICGFRFGADGRSFGYVPDCSRMDDETVACAAGLDVMILDGLRPQPHPTHLTLAESLALLGRIGARDSYITHLCHLLGHAATEARMPPGFHVPHDGLTLEW